MQVIKATGLHRKSGTHPLIAMHEDQQPYTHHQHGEGDPELNVSQNAAPYSRLATKLIMHTNPCLDLEVT
jgi:hypothetical protein